MVTPAAIALVFVFAQTGGCTKPIPRGLDSYDPTGRIQAMLEVAATNDRTQYPQLIAALDSDDSAVRLTAIGTLERLTGQTLGYDHAARESERRAATDRWVEWYEQRSSPEVGMAESRIEGL